MADKRDELTPNQQRFVEEYVIDLNATRAAIRSGYSEKTAMSMGSTLLSNPKVKAAIAEKQRRLSIKTEITAEKVLKEISKIAFSDMRKAANWDENGVHFKGSDEVDDDIAACISEISSVTVHGKNEYAKTTTKIRFHDKMKALDMLARHLGLLAPNSEDDKKKIPLTPENLAELMAAARDDAMKTDAS